MSFSFTSLLQRLAFAGLLGLAAATAAQAKPDPNGPPDQFVLATANEALDVLKADGSVKAGNTARINQVVNEHILPYVNFQKTTRLATGRYWRQATEQQKTALAEAFRGTLVRTYSGALTRVTASTNVRALPFRGDAKADDVVVRTLISQANGQPTGVDYRLERTAQGWKIYDMNVEGIWLIENYRNQFAQQINQNGIDGLIQALNQRNQ
ncbi:MlaC/ttg2D family ABC transporter substrate-binding protein [Achromobacter deleyi]|uniref:MlaC/ttg2D family ABC transporter substrate-binding protein n=1 Tax=Achromobacter deleyi TaxID=1353891 RepID=UPI00149110C2|nr:ABC transporter substrate-binding protein [Achromobacter deleyi]QVQ25291.1 ABC transporter substrate-binding protein [Achromobacter deleyi]UIP20832.1 ABC transporter substrate-binding protein [Achromobacter deleyi]